jgi:hypothetical protein
MRRFLSVILTAVVLASCSGKGEEGAATDAAAASADTLTRRQRDSIIANSKIPGAGAVGRAMGAADAASARTRAEDSAGAFGR